MNSESPRTRNDLNAALVRFCVAIEEHRRTPEGRVRTPAQFLEHFFCVDEATTQTKPDDRVFAHMPKEVRGPILSTWGIRGAKAALRDDDGKVVSVVFDALVAGDLDAESFERGLEPKTLLAWVPLGSFWSFWRAGALNKSALLRAFTSAYDLKLLDARAFFDALRSRGGELTSTDVLGNALTKDDLIEWVRKIHAANDGSPKGLLEALGWEKIIQKAPTEALLGALDALAAKLGLAEPIQTPPASKSQIPEPAIPPETHDADGRTPAGAEVAIESTTAEHPTTKTDPPAAGSDPISEEDVAIAPSATDLAKTGPYATAASRANKSDAIEEEDDSEETKLYRQRPFQRR